MLRRALLAALLVMASLGGAAGAQAATTIGQLPTAMTDICSTGRTYFQYSTGHTPLYTVPAGGGVITSWQTQDLEEDPTRP